MSERPQNKFLTPLKPGQTLPGAGRPKGSLNRSTIARRWLEAAGKITGTTVADELFLAQIKKAMGGDTMAFNAAFDSGMGKLVEKSETTVTNVPDNRQAVVDRMVARKK